MGDAEAQQAVEIIFDNLHGTRAAPAPMFLESVEVPPRVHLTRHTEHAIEFTLGPLAFVPAHAALGVGFGMQGSPRRAPLGQGTRRERQ